MWAQGSRDPASKKNKTQSAVPRAFLWCLHVHRLVAPHACATHTHYKRKYVPFPVLWNDSCRISMTGASAGEAFWWGSSGDGVLGTRGREPDQLLIAMSICKWGLIRQKRRLPDTPKLLMPLGWMKRCWKSEKDRRSSWVFFRCCLFLINFRGWFLLGGCCRNEG